MTLSVYLLLRLPSKQVVDVAANPEEAADLERVLKFAELEVEAGQSYEHVQVILMLQFLALPQSTLLHTSKCKDLEVNSLQKIKQSFSDFLAFYTIHQPSTTHRLRRATFETSLSISGPFVCRQ